jgi:hypothetical protein
MNGYGFFLFLLFWGIGFSTPATCTINEQVIVDTLRTKYKECVCKSGKPTTDLYLMQSLDSK